MLLRRKAAGAWARFCEIRMNGMMGETSHHGVQMEYVKTEEGEKLEVEKTFCYVDIRMRQQAYDGSGKNKIAAGI